VAGTFRNWKMDGFDLTAVMTWTGKYRIEAIGYTVESGVAATSALWAGLIKHEPVKIKIPIPDEPRAR
jgi:hypothetical protein